MDLAPIIQAALTEAAGQASNDLKQQDVPKVTATVTKEVNKEVGAVIENITNQEPWYQSRVILGSLVAVGLSAASLVGVKTDQINPNDVVNLVLQVGTLAGGLFALYGRLTTKPPLGK